MSTHLSHPPCDDDSAASTSSDRVTCTACGASYAKTERWNESRTSSWRVSPRYCPLCGHDTWDEGSVETTVGIVIAIVWVAVLVYLMVINVEGVAW
jgi:hypothetical protein